MPNLSGDTFFLDSFCFRQFDGGRAAQLDVDKEEFVRRVHGLYKKENLRLNDGYAPFCKHLFLRNFTDAKVNALQITKDNQTLLQTAYSKRGPGELAVLTRWFPADAVVAKRAQYLDLILYSREQLMKEYAAKSEEPPDLPDSPWGIISVKPQDENYETPMQPITIMRNALGREEGGSGVPLNRETYEASVEYWQNRAPVIAGNPSGE